MKYLPILFLMSCMSCSLAEIPNPKVVKDNTLDFYLNNFYLLMEKVNPDEFPGILRLIELPDRSDNCAWLTQVEGLTTSFMESGCPAKKLYLTLSNWDIDPQQHSYLLGVGHSWKLVDLVVHHRKTQSDWSALLSLQVVRLVDKKQRTDMVKINITNKYDVYSVQLLSR